MQTNTQVINLGKQLISELRLDSDNDITARWMAHYVAEKIKAVEEPDSAEGTKNTCFNAILKLWEHRYSSPEKVRPFQRFESVFAGLAMLDQTSNLHYFQRFDQFTSETMEELPADTKEWVDMALAVDSGARSIISELFALASESASSDKVREIIDSAPDVQSQDIQILRQLIGGLKVDNEEDKRKELDSKIQKVVGMKEVCEILLGSLNSQIENLNSVEGKEK